MKLSEIVSTDVEVIRPESSLMDAAKRMKFLQVDSLPVCDGRRLLGTINNRDITIHSNAYGHDPNDTLVRDCMNREIVYCFEDQEINEAERIMQEKRLCRLPVLTREKEFVGILILGDLATKTGRTRGPRESLWIIHRAFGCNSQARQTEARMIKRGHW